jgi:HAE1 family hydrophobic/amphiphilic exporter-1
MNISETCIRRPVLTTLMTASLIVFGAFAYRLLPVAALPAVDFPTIQITATLPGASPRRWPPRLRHRSSASSRRFPASRR